METTENCGLNACWTLNCKALALLPKPEWSKVLWLPLEEAT